MHLSATLTAAIALAQLIVPAYASFDIRAAAGDGAYLVVTNAGGVRSPKAAITVGGGYTFDVEANGGRVTCTTNKKSDNLVRFDFGANGNQIIQYQCGCHGGHWVDCRGQTSCPNGGGPAC